MTGVRALPTQVERSEEILTDEALAFLADLQRRFGPVRDGLLQRRVERRAEIARTHRLDLLPETAAIREDPSWRVAPAPADLLDRRVEITGPTERKMAINALNSGARVWLADLEDANTPHWDNVVAGQVNLADAIRRTIDFTSPEGKEYRLREDGQVAVIVMRPRGWHLEERHILVDGQATVAAVVDFGLYFFHNARELLARGSGPYLYLPKMESHQEARLWADIFRFSEQRLGIQPGSVRATVLIETITAGFEMEEILYELRDYAAGLNAGRWDYLFSLIKVFRAAGPDFVLPDRNSVTMTAPFMRAYTELLVRTCHKRGAFAMGGMAAFIPNRRDPEVTERALAKVRADKEREADDGFDGSWVAHPDLVPVCQEVFDRVLGDRPNQLDRLRDDVAVDGGALLAVSQTPGEVTEEGLRSNVTVAIRYLAAWLGGNGAVAINDMMEDAATAEISRSQVWQWAHASVPLAGGGTVTPELVRSIVGEEARRIEVELGAEGYAQERYEEARQLFERVALEEPFIEFLTLPAYDLIA
ncbi:MAG: malate synthase A [Chloroflexota bacterium]|nr:malate synthase A [Chloroflexota bacterium]